MEFRDTKYVEVELTAEEKTKLHDTKLILYKLLEYTNANVKTTIDYADYDGGGVMKVDRLDEIIHGLDNIYNIKGVE